MNYEPNTTHWKVGELVIHDADAKNADMLMKVVGYDKDGLCITEYVSRDGHRKRYHNDIRYLHDPARFGIVRG